MHTLTYMNSYIYVSSACIQNCLKIEQRIPCEIPNFMCNGMKTMRSIYSISLVFHNARSMTEFAVTTSKIMLDT